MPIVLNISAFKLPIQQQRQLTAQERQHLYEGAEPVYDYAPVNGTWSTINWEAFNNQFKALCLVLESLCDETHLFLTAEEAADVTVRALAEKTKDRDKYKKKIRVFAKEVCFYQHGAVNKTLYSKKDGHPTYFRDLKYALEVIVLTLISEINDLKVKSPYDINDKIATLKRFHETVEEASVCNEGAYVKLIALKDEIQPNKGIKAIVASQLDGVFATIGAQHNQRVMNNFELMLTNARDRARKNQIIFLRDELFMRNEVHTPDFIKALFQAKGLLDPTVPTLAYDYIPKFHQQDDRLFYLNDPDGNALQLTDVDLNETFENEFRKQFNAKSVVDHLAATLYETIRALYGNCERACAAGKHDEAMATARDEVHQFMVECGFENEDEPHTYGFFDTMDESWSRYGQKSSLEVFYWSRVFAARGLAREGLVAGIELQKADEEHYLVTDGNVQWLEDSRGRLILLSEISLTLIERLMNANQLRSYGLVYALSQTYPAEFDLTKPIPDTNALRVKLRVLAKQLKVDHNLAQVYSSQPVFVFESITDLKAIIDKFLENYLSEEIYRVRLAIEKHSRSAMQAFFSTALNDPVQQRQAMQCLTTLSEVEPFSTNDRNEYPVTLSPASIYISEAYLISLLGKSAGEVEEMLPFSWRGAPPEKIPPYFYAFTNHENMRGLYPGELDAVFELCPPLIVNYLTDIPPERETDAFNKIVATLEKISQHPERKNLLARLLTLSLEKLLSLVKNIRHLNALCASHFLSDDQKIAAVETLITRDPGNFSLISLMLFLKQKYDQVKGTFTAFTEFLDVLRCVLARRGDKQPIIDLLKMLLMLSNDNRSHPILLGQIDLIMKSLDPELLRIWMSQFLPRIKSLALYQRIAPLLEGTPFVSARELMSAKQFQIINYNLAQCMYPLAERAGILHIERFSDIANLYDQLGNMQRFALEFSRYQRVNTSAVLTDALISLKNRAKAKKIIDSINDESANDAAIDKIYTSPTLLKVWKLPGDQWTDALPRTWARYLSDAQIIKLLSHEQRLKAFVKDDAVLFRLFDLCLASSESSRTMLAIYAEVMVDKKKDAITTLLAYHHKRFSESLETKSGFAVRYQMISPWIRAFIADLDDICTLDAYLLENFGGDRGTLQVWRKIVILPHFSDSVSGTEKRSFVTFSLIHSISPLAKHPSGRDLLAFLLMEVTFQARAHLIEVFEHTIIASPDHLNFLYHNESTCDLIGKSREDVKAYPNPRYFILWLVESIVDEIFDAVLVDGAHADDVVSKYSMLVQEDSLDAKLAGKNDDLEILHIIRAFLIQAFDALVPRNDFPEITLHDLEKNNSAIIAEFSSSSLPKRCYLRLHTLEDIEILLFHASEPSLAATRALQATYRPRLQTILSDSLLSDDPKVRPRVINVLKALISSTGYTSMFLTQGLIDRIVEQRDLSLMVVPERFSVLGDIPIYTLRYHAAIDQTAKRHSLGEVGFLSALFLTNTRMIYRYIIRATRSDHDSSRDSLRHEQRLYEVCAMAMTAVAQLSTAPGQQGRVACLAEALSSHLDSVVRLRNLLYDQKESNLIKDVICAAYRAHPGELSLDEIEAHFSRDERHLLEIESSWCESLVKANLEANPPKTPEECVSLIRKRNYLKVVLVRSLLALGLASQVTTELQGSLALVNAMIIAGISGEYITDAIRSVCGSELRETLIAQLLVSWKDSSSEGLELFSLIRSIQRPRGLIGGQIAARYDELKLRCNTDLLEKKQAGTFVIDDFEDLRQLLSWSRSTQGSMRSLKVLYDNLPSTSFIEGLFISALFQGDTQGDAVALLNVFASYASKNDTIFFNRRFVNYLLECTPRVRFNIIPDRWKSHLSRDDLFSLVKDYADLVAFAGENLETYARKFPELIGRYLCEVPEASKPAAIEHAYEVVRAIPENRARLVGMGQFNQSIILPGFISTFSPLCSLYQLSLIELSQAMEGVSITFHTLAEKCIQNNSDLLTLDSFKDYLQLNPEIPAAFKIEIFRLLLKPAKIQTLIRLLCDSSLMAHDGFIEEVIQHPESKLFGVITVDQINAMSDEVLEQMGGNILLCMNEVKRQHLNASRMPKKYIVASLLLSSDLTTEQFQLLETLFLQWLYGESPSQNKPLHLLFMNALVDSHDIELIDLSQDYNRRFLHALFNEKSRACEHGRDYSIVKAPVTVGLRENKVTHIFYRDSVNHIYVDWLCQNGRCKLTFGATFSGYLGNEFNRSSNPHFFHYESSDINYEVTSYVFSMSDTDFDKKYLDPLNLEVLHADSKPSLLARFSARIKKYCETNPSYANAVFRPAFHDLLITLINKNHGQSNGNRSQSLAELPRTLPEGRTRDGMSLLLTITGQTVFYHDLAKRTSLSDFFNAIRGVSPSIYEAIIHPDFIHYVTTQWSTLTSNEQIAVRDDLLAFLQLNSLSLIKAKTPLKSIFQILRYAVADEVNPLPILLTFLSQDCCPTEEVVALLDTLIDEDNVESILVAVHPHYWQGLLQHLNIIPVNCPSFAWLNPSDVYQGPYSSRYARLLNAYHLHRHNHEGYGERVSRWMGQVPAVPDLIATVERLTLSGRFSASEMAELRPVFAKHFAEIYRRQARDQARSPDIVTQSILDSMK